jgi:hypothetical protein
MLMRRLFVHRSRMGASWARDSIFLVMVGNLGSNKMDLARMEGCNHWVEAVSQEGLLPPWRSLFVESRRAKPERKSWDQQPRYLLGVPTVAPSRGPT